MAIKGTDLTHKGFSRSRHAITASHATKKAAITPQAIKDAVPPVVFVELGIKGTPVAAAWAMRIHSIAAGLLVFASRQ
jgi:hypothetical protein